MSLSIKTQNPVFFSDQSIWSRKHLRSLSYDSFSTNSGPNSYIAVSRESSRKSSFQEEEVTNVASNQLSRIPSPRDIAIQTDAFSDKQVECQTLDKTDPMQIAMFAINRMTQLEKELQACKIMQQQRMEQEAKRMEQEAINQSLQQGLLEELKRTNEELEITKKELQAYQMGQEATNRDLKKNRNI